MPDDDPDLRIMLEDRREAREERRGKGDLEEEAYPSSNSPKPAASSNVRDAAVVRESVESVHANEGRNDLRADECHDHKIRGSVQERPILGSGDEDSCLFRKELALL